MSVDLRLIIQIHTPEITQGYHRSSSKLEMDFVVTSFRIEVVVLMVVVNQVV